MSNKVTKEIEEYIQSSLDEYLDFDSKDLVTYICALIENDNSSRSLFKDCKVQLEEFLEENTTTFVTNLFDHLKAQGVVVDGSTENGYYSPDLDETAVNGNIDSDRNSSYSPGEELKNITERMPAPLPIHPESALYANYTNFSSKIVPMCYNYQNTGYCQRGEYCNYSHGELPNNLLDNVNKAPQNGNTYESYRTQVNTKSFRRFVNQVQATNSRLNPITTENKLKHPQVYNNAYSYSKEYPSKGFNYEGTTKPQFATFSPNILVVTNIPAESRNEETIREFFSKFGTVDQVTISEKSSKADLQFNTPEAATKALESSEPMFNNRFVDLYRKKIYNTPVKPIEPSTENIVEVKIQKEPKKILTNQEKLEALVKYQKKNVVLLEKYINEQKSLKAKLETNPTNEETKKVLESTLESIQAGVKKQLTIIKQLDLKIEEFKRISSENNSATEVVKSPTLIGTKRTATEDTLEEPKTKQNISNDKKSELITSAEN